MPKKQTPLPWPPHGFGQREGTPDAKWLTAIAKARDNKDEHYSMLQLGTFLWQQGFGPVAAARIYDWYLSCHPCVIEMRRREREASGEPASPPPTAQRFRVPVPGPKPAQIGPDCPKCGAADMRRNGIDAGRQRWICRGCKRGTTIEGAPDLPVDRLIV